MARNSLTFRVSSRSEFARSSPDGRLLAYSVDTTGDEVYALRLPRSGDADVTFRTALPRYVLHRRVERRLAHVLLHGARRRCTGRTRSGGTRSARRPPTTSWSSPRTTRGSSSPCGPAAAARTSSSRRANRDTSETWLIPADDPARRAVRRAPARAGRRVPRRPLPARPTGSTSRPTTAPPEFRLMRAPVDAPAGQWTELRPPGRASGCTPATSCAATCCSSCAATASRCCGSWTGRRAGARDHRRRPRPGTITLDTPFEYDDTGRDRRRRVADRPARVVRRRPAHRRTAPLRKRRAVPGYDPAAYRTRRGHATGGRRHPGAGHPRLAGRHPARRHRPRACCGGTAPTSRATTRRSTRCCRACSTGAWSTR